MSCDVLPVAMFFQSMFNIECCMSINVVYHVTHIQLCLKSIYPDCRWHLGCVDKDLWVSSGRCLQRYFQTGFRAHSVKQAEGTVHIICVRLCLQLGFDQADESLDGSNVEGDEGAAADGEEGLNNQEGVKKRKRIKKSATVEKNLKNINIGKMELEFDVDPLFKKTTSQFDAAGDNSTNLWICFEIITKFLNQVVVATSFLPL